MYVYRKTEPNLFTVGFYAPTGKWTPESDWPDSESAAKRVNFLNGGVDPEVMECIASAIECLVQGLNSKRRKELHRDKFGVLTY